MGTSTAMVAESLRSMNRWRVSCRFLLFGAICKARGSELGGVVLLSGHVGRQAHWICRGAHGAVRSEQVVRKVTAGNRSEIRAHRLVGAVIGVGEEVLQLVMV